MGLYVCEDKRIISKVPGLPKKICGYNNTVILKIYTCAYHAFYNDTCPQIYNEIDIRDAWIILMYLFKENL